MALDLSALKPDPDASTEASESSPLLDALDQMRELCDRIEAEQMTASRAPPVAPVKPEMGEEP